MSETHDSIRDNYVAMCDRLASAGFSRPETYDDWVSLCRVIQFPEKLQRWLQAVCWRRPQNCRILDDLNDPGGYSSISSIFTLVCDEALAFAERRAFGTARTESPTTADGESPTVKDFHSAEWLSINEGIVSERLSEAARVGKVRCMNVPKGYTDVELRKPRKLYHVGDAKKHCTAKLGPDTNETRALPKTHRLTRPL